MSRYTSSSTAPFVLRNARKGVVTGQTKELGENEHGMNWKDIYNHKWFPRLFYTKPDGGIDSGVTGYFLIEWKPVVSIGFLHFEKGTREVYHSHAFNAITWWLTGAVVEDKLYDGFKAYAPSLRPKYTPRNKCHKVLAKSSTWAFTIRGPWHDTWIEVRFDKDRNQIRRVLTHGRKVVE